jgi:hypothetical protein
MSDEKPAALDPLDAFVQEALDQATEETKTEDQPVESAPTVDAITPEATVATEPKGDEPKEDGFQKRINKVTADKHEERRKREAVEKKLSDLQKQVDDGEANKPTLEQPTLEQHDYDEDAFNKASVSYQVQEQVKSELTSQKAKQEQSDQQAKMQQSLKTFNERATALGKDDFEAKAQAIPELPEGVASAIMDLDNGAEMVYHLGTHLDKADSLANMTPMAAMMELGRISAQMSVKPEIKTSAAPDPIEPVTAGSALSDKIDDEMSIDAWMAKYN